MKRRSIPARKRAGDRPVSAYQRKQLRRAEGSAIATALIEARRVTPEWKPKTEGA